MGMDLFRIQVKDMEKILIIFRADMSLFVHIDNKRKDLVKVQILSYHSLAAKKCIRLILLKLIQNFAIGPNSYLFVNGTEIYKFNAKDSGIRKDPEN